MEISTEDNTRVRSVDDLLSVFRAAEKPASAFLLGMEAEKFGVHSETFAPLAYEGDHGVVRVLEALQHYGWEPESETVHGPLIALRRGHAQITLEPGAQLELSGAPLPDVHAVLTEFEQHLSELAPISRTMKLAWLSVGFHPLAAQAELPWVPKLRYGVMREYLPPRGRAAHDMMRRTATVQVNLDYSSEADAMRKLRVGLLLAPLLNALLANSPFREGRTTNFKSLRGDVWLHMDPARSGLIDALFERDRPTYRDYVEWVLDAGMFLVKRGDRVLPNAGQTFRDFLANGFDGEHATLGDWKLHLNTMFPEVRLKSTLELRSCDALPVSLIGAVPALGAGLFYDDHALSEAERLAESMGLEAVKRSREELVTRGLEGSIGGVPARALAERVLRIAMDGLDRRGRRSPTGKTESAYLEPLVALTSKGKSPADRMLEGLGADEEPNKATLIARARIDA
jgi:glutamate--cysteine ligase